VLLAGSAGLLTRRGGGPAAFREFPNTFLLPHIGSATRETRVAMGFRSVDNLDAIFAGRGPRDRVA
jgi:lactate dehydrogenase-like 2-hydroxyacid dehydrogenase